MGSQRVNMDKESGMSVADAAMAELKRQIAEDHKPGYGVHKTSDKANHRYRDGFVAGFVAAVAILNQGSKEC